MMNENMIRKRQTQICRGRGHFKKVVRRPLTFVFLFLILCWPGANHAQMCDSIGDNLKSDFAQEEIDLGEIYIRLKVHDAGRIKLAQAWLRTDPNQPDTDDRSIKGGGKIAFAGLAQRIFSSHRNDGRLCHIAIDYEGGAGSDEITQEGG